MALSIRCRQGCGQLWKGFRLCSLIYNEHPNSRGPRLRYRRPEAEILDTCTGVALLEYRYNCPFKFTGKINKLTFDLGPAQYTDEDRRKLPAIADAVARAKD
jgi:hypothetical protein